MGAMGLDVVVVVGREVGRPGCGIGGCHRPQPATGSVPAMHRLWPDPSAVDDVAALVTAEARPSHPDRPWLLVNMISSLDGAIAIDGRSGGLGGPADKAMFSALRGIADVILVGAGTARAEGYGPPRPTDATRAARAARGQAPTPRLALVTRSLDLDLTTPLFTAGDAPPYVVTSGAASPERLDAIDAVAEVLVAGVTEVDLTNVLARLHDDGARRRGLRRRSQPQRRPARPRPRR